MKGCQTTAESLRHFFYKDKSFLRSTTDDITVSLLPSARFDSFFEILQT